MFWTEHGGYNYYWSTNNKKLYKYNTHFDKQLLNINFWTFWNCISSGDGFDFGGRAIRVRVPNAA